LRFSFLLAAFAIFTLLDAAATVVGLEVGLVELNPVVLLLGIPFWALFRILLLGSMLTIFFFGHKFLMTRFDKGAMFMRITLLFLDVYIGMVVIWGIIAISFRLLF
jgi:hypothetical protein